jgi:hypothetical protein
LASEYIDAARVYNRALTAPEVSDLYHATGNNKSRDTRCKAARWETNKSLSPPQIFGTYLFFAPDSAAREGAGRGPLSLYKSP